MLTKTTIIIDGKEVELTGGVSVTYQPKITEELVKAFVEASKPIVFEFTNWLTSPEFENLKAALGISENNIDFTELENQVIDMWENEGVTYFETENVGFNPPDPAHYQTSILPEYQAILDDPMECISALGYNSLAEYLAENQEPTPARNITFYMSGVLSKQFREATCQN